MIHRCVCVGGGIWLDSPGHMPTDPLSCTYKQCAEYVVHMYICLVHYQIRSKILYNTNNNVCSVCNVLPL